MRQLAGVSHCASSLPEVPTPLETARWAECSEVDVRCGALLLLAGVAPVLLFLAFCDDVSRVICLSRGQHWQVWWDDRQLVRLAVACRKRS